MRETHQISGDVRAHSDGTALWWLGNAGWAIKSDGVTLLVDPVIELADSADPTRSEIGLGLVHALPMRASEFEANDVDLCLVTHAHGDHLAPRTIPALAAHTRCRFVTPLSCMREMGRLGIPAERIIAAQHGRAIQHKHLTIEPLKALHGHERGAVYAGANFEDCGYLIHDGRWTILHPGDSVLLQEHLELRPPDVYLVSISEHNTWVQNSALLANLWRPRYVLPMHYDTYVEPLFWTRGDPQAVRAALDEGMRAHFVVLEQGQKLLLAG
jgi:L-ascorbate 6-phosphate lactonase